MKWSKDNPERKQQTDRRFRLKHIDKIRAGQRVYYLKNRERLLRAENVRARKKKYGVSRELYEEMLLEQGGVCAICSRPPVRLELCLDHDHQGKEPRGLLCHPCNKALGQFGDTVEGLMKAVRYLSRSKKHVRLS